MTEPTKMHGMSPLKSRIFQAALDIHHAGRQVTRVLLSERTNLKFAIIDDHVKGLCDEGKLRRVVPGVLEPTEVFPSDRPVSKTVLAEGWVKVEVGEHELMITPGEARKVGLALYGDAMEFAHIRGERETYDTVHGLRQQLRALERRLADTMRGLAQIEQGRRQDDLFAKEVTA